MAGLKFPFQKGTTNFPDTNETKLDEIIDNVRSLLSTGIDEIPMGIGIGVNIRSLIFSNMTKIDQAMLGQSIRNAIIDGEPRMLVLGVDIQKEKNITTVEILFEVAGTVGSMNMPYQTP